MKRRILVLILAIATALGLAAVAAACAGTDETVDYSVTVLSPDDSPLSEVDVLWKNGDTVAGTAKTNSEGKATASLAAGTYSVTLENFGLGYSYTPASVTADMRDAEIKLSAVRVNYSVTVTDKDGAAASGVTVSWTNADTIVGTATTDASGNASCELNYGTYSVMLSDLPEGNVFGGATASGSNPALNIELRGGVTVPYGVTVLSPDERPLSDVVVLWTSGNTLMGLAITDGEGRATASLVAGTYRVMLGNFGEAYTYTPVSVTSVMRNLEMTLSLASVNYTVTVTDKNGAAASGIFVSWSKDNSVAGTATTNASGKASCELEYGDYSVTLADLPEGNVYDGAKTVSGSNPALTFELREGVTVPYSVTVLSEKNYQLI